MISIAIYGWNNTPKGLAVVAKIGNAYAFCIYERPDLRRPRCGWADSPELVARALPSGVYYISTPEREGEEEVRSREKIVEVLRRI